MALVKKRKILGLVTGSESLAQMFGPESDLLDLFGAVVTGRRQERENLPLNRTSELSELWGFRERVVMLSRTLL